MFGAMLHGVDTSFIQKACDDYLDKCVRDMLGKIYSSAQSGTI